MNLMDPHEPKTNWSRYRQYGTSTGVKQYAVDEVLRAVHTMKTFGAAPSTNVSLMLLTSSLFLVKPGSGFGAEM